MPRTAPYGSWDSPIRAADVAGQSVGLSTPRIDGGDLYWIESRPLEAGRSVIVRRRATGETQDVIEAPWSARTRVHEYGGGAFAATAGTAYFSNFTDQHVYRAAPGTATQPLYTAPGRRYADFCRAASRFAVGRPPTPRPTSTGTRPARSP